MLLRHCLLCLALATAAPVFAADITFWDTPQRGGNSFNENPPDRAYFQALRDTGATWVRLSPDKWKSAGGRDFLMGDADRYQGLVQADVAILRRALDDANASGLKVVLVPLSLPLLRWKQKNNGVVDQRLWQSMDNHLPAQRFWHDLATALKGHPALAAYNLINEPVPEYGAGLAEHASTDAMRQWYAGVQDGPRDLRRFYSALIASIREVDADMPLMLDAGWYAAADGFNYWPAPLADTRLLYSVHMYEPYAATSAPNQKRATPYRYPGLVPFGEHSERWDAARVQAYLQQPMNWARTHGIGANRMVIGEFGCMRRWPDCARYLRDVLAVAEQQRVHWAFYAFREDGWDGMDYELGDTALPGSYWQAVEKGEPVQPPRSMQAPLFAPILQRLKDGAR
ncbi:MULTISPECIES: cellulase family glycosylhydrolase [Stenotrophomonas]|uniref:glycoside hydrolase family 5 protein n=1 Tax=Stenotrophomonas TaxID=40323 RepID=UPI00201CD29D|nr:MULTISPECIES: cellulase family glycosylhydrolase [Stenotrophomonas]MDH1272682.1 glycoside hydrolase family 5 protein [Stenotrophomonas sp. GD03937]MDH1484704.1 glycoside hydrolase family 5 protein [Stenotrophomonas sp. GD03712]UQY97625.1 glycoside hydrolase family 5 protein [Stenotrophomonas maltophilia]WON69905.1 cellulase family glycosylhydrolase [Stenotrophomonas maltophilia]